MELVRRFRRIIHLDFRAAARTGQDPVRCRGIVLDRAYEGLIPLLDLAIADVDPVKMRLEIAVWAGDVADANEEEDMARVVRPPWTAFFAFIMRDAAGL